MRADTYFDLGVAGDDRTKIEFVYRLRAGWPLLALYGDCWDVVVWDDTSQDYVESHTEHEWAVPFEAESKPFANVDPIPLGIVWWGFLIDTLLFAGLLWLPIRGPFVLRRHIRRKRGRCPKCGYDLRGDLEHGCPECGWNRQPEATA